MSLSPEEFVRAYMQAFKEGLTPRELYERLGMSKVTFSSRKGFYQKHGVELPDLKRARGAGRKKTDFSALNALVKGLL